MLLWPRDWVTSGSVNKKSGPFGPLFELIDGIEGNVKCRNQPCWLDPLLLLLFLLVVDFVLFLDLLLFLQGDLGDANFGHTENDVAVRPFIEILQAFNPFSAGHYVPALDRPSADFQALIESHKNVYS